MQFAGSLPAEGVSGCRECCSPGVAALQVCELRRDAPKPARYLQELASLGLVH